MRNAKKEAILRKYYCTSALWSLFGALYSICRRAAGRACMKYTVELQFPCNDYHQLGQLNCPQGLYTLLIEAN